MTRLWDSINSELAGRVATHRVGKARQVIDLHPSIFGACLETCACLDDMSNPLHEKSAPRAPLAVFGYQTRAEFLASPSLTLGLAKVGSLRPPRFGPLTPTARKSADAHACQSVVVRITTHKAARDASARRASAEGLQETLNPRLSTITLHKIPRLKVCLCSWVSVRTPVVSHLNARTGLVNFENAILTALPNYPACWTDDHVLVLEFCAWRN